jgi:hypothetical protein
VVVGGPLNQQQQSSTIDWRAALRVQVLQVDECWIAAPTDGIEGFSGQWWKWVHSFHAKKEIEDHTLRYTHTLAFCLWDR